MSDIAINPVTRRVQFTGNTGTGPYAFTFNILVSGDIAVFKGTTELTLTTDYSVSINANGTGSITLVVALIASDILTIIGGRELSRTTDFVTAGDLLASSLNEQLDSNVIMTQQLDEKLNRGLYVNPGDVYTDLELPLKDARKGTVLGFNATTGDPEPGPEIADVDSLAVISADIKTLAEIQDGTVATDAITNVNTIRANVSTVAGISGNVTTVAGNTTNINAVVANDTNINTVAGIDANVTTVAGISGNVTSVAGNATNINTVAADGADIGSVAGSISNVNTVAGDITNVNTNATNIASINTNAANITDIQNAEENAASALASKNAAGSSETAAASSASTASTQATTATTKASEAATSASNASTSASTATTQAGISTTKAGEAASSETAAAGSASTASTQAGIATTKASESAASASASATSATASEAAKDAALSALDNFQDQYLGDFATDPTTDNDGDPLQAGMLYFNTTDDVMKVYTGSAWVAAYASLSGALLVNNNLSDLASASAGRTNLGLGTGNSPTFAGLTTTADVSFGDNDKAIFGAGSDLQIYHDGSNSYIDDAGTGNLRIRGSQVILEKYTGETILQGIADGSVYIFHDNAEKLATTATGIDVTGTVTADGLTNSGTSQFDASISLGVAGASNGFINSPSGIFVNIDSDNNQTDRFFDIRRNSTDGSGPLIFKAEESGDISFYEDTGTTAKLFWDASTERLGLGTTAPATNLEIRNASAPATLKMVQSGAGQFTITTESGLTTLAVPDTGGGLAFGTGTGGSERMRIDASGNLLVGQSSFNTGIVGGGITNYGFNYGTVNGGVVARFTRLTSDGDIVQFRKDGSTVGSIGVDGSHFEINTEVGTGALSVGGSRKFQWANTVFYPLNDNSADLGHGSYRFKDGHFSGTVNAGNFNTTSDATLKTNVETLTGSLDAVKSLRGVSYDWIESGGSEVGVIAQEVEAVLPDVVSTNDEGIKSVKYGNMVAVLIEAIKEQQAQIDELKSKLGE